MAGELQPLAQNFKIVDENGFPTIYFIKWAQQRQIDISEGITLQNVIDYLNAHALQEGSGIQITPDGEIPHMPTIAADVQEILDQVTATRGAILYRGLLGWAALVPGTAGYVLSTNGAGADPSWIAAGGGGGGVTAQEITPTKPLAANFTLLNGGGTSTLTDKTFGLLLDSPSTAGATTHFACSNTAPSAVAFTLTAKIKPTWPFTGGNYENSIILRNNTNGRLMHWAQDSGTTRMVISIWSAYATWAGDVFSGSTDTPWWPWRRVVLAAGTLSFQVSVDGDVWYQIFTYALATYLTAAGGNLDQVGFGGWSQNGTLCNSWTVV